MSDTATATRLVCHAKRDRGNCGGFVGWAPAPARFLMALERCPEEPPAPGVQIGRCSDRECKRWNVYLIDETP